MDKFLMENTKTFISYSWSNPVHEQWVIDLASNLRESGVDVILDKWDLKDGHDAIAFMEKMVTDENIKKVIIISDRVYVDKANGRDGGVGTETQIISKEVYDNQAQDKFVLIVTEKDEDGNAYVPAYYKSRIHIDLSEPDKYSENYERLLRWIYDKPLHIKPALGNIPAFLTDENPINLGTTSTFKRAMSGLKDHKPFMHSALDEYLSLFSSNLENFRITKSTEEFDDQVISNIEAFIPYRNQLVQLFIQISTHSDIEDFIPKLHRFMESLLPYLDQPANVGSWMESDFDNFRFIIHEIFLYLIAVLVKAEKFSAAAYFLIQRYYSHDNSSYGSDPMLSYLAFYRSTNSFDRRNSRLELNKHSLRANSLEERSVGTGLEFRYLMQADFILYLRSEIKSLGLWWPETLAFIGRHHSAFEIFARSSSSSYFENIKPLLGVDSKEDLELLVSSYHNGARQMPRWSVFPTAGPSILIGIEQICQFD